MALVVGSVVEGKVTGLTKFGAFVELTEGKTGMVHISEVASAFVKEISDFLTVGQEVKVKVLAIDEAGKISLSIKKAVPQESAPNKERDRDRDNNGGHQRRSNNNRGNANVWNGPKSSASNENLSFEEMMSKFKQVSDEKMTDLKRSSESKHGGGFNRRGGNRQYK